MYWFGVTLRLEVQRGASSGGRKLLLGDAVPQASWDFPDGCQLRCHATILFGLGHQVGASAAPPQNRILGPVPSKYCMAKVPPFNRYSLFRRNKLQIRHSPVQSPVELRLGEPI